MRAIKILVPMFVLMLAIMPAQAKEEAPMTVEGATTISTGDAKALFDKGAIFVDVRGGADFEAGRIPGAVHLDLKSTLTEAALMEAADKGQDIVMYCNGQKCGLSSAASVKAVAWGFTAVKCFRDGFPGWQTAGYPVE
jgi:rhodanese-related sulfurtransferase